MQINEIHSITIALSEEEHAKLEAASDILNKIMGSPIGNYKVRTN